MTVALICHSLPLSPFLCPARRRDRRYSIAYYAMSPHLVELKNDDTHVGLVSQTKNHDTHEYSIVISRRLS